MVRHLATEWSEDGILINSIFPSKLASLSDKLAGGGKVGGGGAAVGCSGGGRAGGGSAGGGRAGGPAPPIPIWTVNRSRG